MRLQKPTWLLLTALASVHGCGEDENDSATVIDPVFGAACKLVTCPEMAECVVLGSGQTDCQCQIGYQGEKCDRCESGYHRDSVDRCVPDRSCAEQDPCAPNGVCSDRTGVIECKCAARYAGPRCSVCAPPYRPDSEGDCVASPAGDAAMASDASMDASASDGGPPDSSVAEDSGLPDSANVDSTVVIDGSLVLDSSLVDSSLPDSSLVDSSVLIDSSLVDSSVPIDSAVVDSSLGDAAAIDSSVVDSSVVDASVCNTHIVRQNFESLPNWPNAANTCTGIGNLVASAETFRSRQGDTAVQRCAPSTFNGLTTRHVELSAGPGRLAEITFSEPASFVSFSAGALTSAVSVEVRADGIVVSTFSIPATSSQVVNLSLTKPTTTISLRSLTPYNQNVCIDNIEHHTKKCQ